MKCPECGARIPPDAECPECGFKPLRPYAPKVFDEGGSGKVEPEEAVGQEDADRDEDAVA